MKTQAQQCFGNRVGKAFWVIFFWRILDVSKFTDRSTRLEMERSKSLHLPVDIEMLRNAWVWEMHTKAVLSLYRIFKINPQQQWCYCCWCETTDAVKFFLPVMTLVMSKELGMRPSRPIDAPTEMNVCVKRGDPGRSSCRSGRRDCHSLVKLLFTICTISTTPQAVCYANRSKGKKKTNKYTRLMLLTHTA